MGTSTATGLFKAMETAETSLVTIEGQYNAAAAGVTGTTDLASLMSKQADLSLLGLKMQAATSTFDKLISTTQQAGQKIMQS